MRHFLMIVMACVILPLAACGKEKNSPSPSFDLAEAKTEGACMVGGCSGQLCIRADQADGAVTTCEWTAAYGCYSQFGMCAQNADGSCGWRDTPDLRNCLAQPDDYTLRSLQPMGDQDRDALTLQRGESPRHNPLHMQ